MSRIATNKFRPTADKVAIWLVLLESGLELS